MSLPHGATSHPYTSGAGLRRRRRRQGTVAREAAETVRRVIIVGTTDSARQLAKTISESQDPHYELVGFLADGETEQSEPLRSVDGVRVLGAPSDMFTLAHELGVDEVIIADLPEPQRRLGEDIAINGNGRPTIHLVPGAYEAMVRTPRIERISDVPLMTLNCDRSAWHTSLQRAFDVLFSTFALAFFSPLMLLAAILIKLSSRGSVVYRQERVGLDGREFVLLKFRTMVADAEKDTGPVLCSEYDSRLTPVGRLLRRLKLDELPQFVNVLKGEMSVIGPRPERRVFVDQYTRLIPGYNARHQVKPGITGLAQVYGRYATDPANKLKYDLMYVYGSSLWMDLKILLLTLPAMLAGK